MVLACEKVLVKLCQSVVDLSVGDRCSIYLIDEEAAKLEQTSIRVEMAGKTVRYLAQILSHNRVTPDLLKDCLPKFINYVIWRKDPKTPNGRFEIALFERPFRGDEGRLLRKIVDDLEGGRNGANGASRS